MQTYRCKCGESKVISSIGVPACETCDKCGSTFATYPSFLPEQIPHNLKTQYDQNTGKPYQICTRCMAVFKDGKS